MAQQKRCWICNRLRPADEVTVVTAHIYNSKDQKTRGNYPHSMCVTCNKNHGDPQKLVEVSCGVYIVHFEMGSTCLLWTDTLVSKAVPE